VIRDDISITNVIVGQAYKLAQDKDRTDEYAVGYRQGVFDLAGQLLWPDEDWNSQRDRLRRLFDARRALGLDMAQ
jgi:hypothetical protein